MTEPGEDGRTLWARRDTPLRRFLGTETGSAAVLLAGAVAALVWVNVDSSSYQSVWTTDVSLRVGQWTLSMDIRDWVNSGLMTFFFFVIGLEARREVDMGELREWARGVLPLAAGVAGMAAAVATYLLVTAGTSSAHGWGVAMSTDTAFTLGVLALVGRWAPDRLRSFILTVVVVDDVVALLVIAVAYSSAIRWTPLLIGLSLFAVVLLLVRLHVDRGLVYLVLLVACWVAVLHSGIDPVVVGLAAGAATFAAPPARQDLERATERFRGFREQPTPELARSAQASLQAALSPNERWQLAYHPWTSYVVVPLFALANAGIAIDAHALSQGYQSRITLAIIAGYLLGKPLGVALTTAVVSRLSGGRLRPPVGWVAVAGAGTLAGVGFTVSLLIATLAFRGRQLEEAKLGILTAAVGAAALTVSLFALSSRLPKPLRLRALLGASDVIVDLVEPVVVGRDHIRGPDASPVTVVEYGDFECPYCGLAEPSVRELLADFGDVRYVWRQLPLRDVHPRAQLAAEASEAAAAQGKFWPMHDLLLAHQSALTPKDLIGYATELGLDVERFTDELRDHAHADRVAADVESADLSAVTGTPTFFINGQRHTGAYDLATLTRAVKTARARADVPARPQRRRRSTQPEPDVR